MSVTIETDLKEILTKLDQKLDNLQKDVTDVKIGLTEVKGEIKTLDERLTGKIETLDERLTGKMEALDERLTGKIEALDERLTGKIEALDERLTGKIEALDEKLSGQIQTLDTKVDGLSIRVQNQEFTSRAILGGLLLIVLGGAAKMFGFIPPSP